MNYMIQYSCVSHIGLCRAMNQDNFICRGEYIRDPYRRAEQYQCGGVVSAAEISLFGVFDGMGGEERGEIASFLAAKAADEMEYKTSPVEYLEDYCKRANEDICRYMKENEIRSMGTTAAMLLFSAEGINLCNIGDSRIFLLSGHRIREISEAHVSVAAHGVKPPLLQNLGIHPSEFLIHPYLARGSYHEKDLFLICSDGLTDMLTVSELEYTMKRTPFDQLADTLLQKALKNGGTDNITMILCQVCLGRKRWKHSVYSFINKKIYKRSKNNNFPEAMEKEEKL